MPKSSSNYDQQFEEFRKWNADRKEKCLNAMVLDCYMQSLFVWLLRRAIAQDGRSEFKEVLNIVRDTVQNSIGSTTSSLKESNERLGVFAHPELSKENVEDMQRNVPETVNVVYMQLLNSLAPEK